MEGSRLIKFGFGVEVLIKKSPHIPSLNNYEGVFDFAQKKFRRTVIETFLLVLIIQDSMRNLTEK